MKDPRDPRIKEPKPKKSQGPNNSGNSSGNPGNSSAKKRKWGNRNKKKNSAPTTLPSEANATPAADETEAVPVGQKQK